MMLSLGDLNLIIKFYAYRIQQRIEELEHLNYNFAPQDDPEADSQEYEFISAISKYHAYTTRDEKEARLARKLVERVLQIYEFFKAKSNSQNLLALIQQKITAELNAIVAAPTVNLGELFSYVHLLTKRGCVVKVPAEKRRTLSKSIIR